MNKVLLNSPLESTAFEFPRSSTAPPPDIAALIKDLVKNQAEVEALVKTYTYHEVDEEEGNERDDEGSPNKKSVKDYDVFYLGGAMISRLVAKDGKPLSEEEQKKEDSRVDKESEEYKKQQAKMTDKQKQKEESEEDADISMFLRVARFTNPRWERFRGAQVVVFDFSGNPDYKPRNLIEKYIFTLAGTMWVDPRARD